MIVDWKIIFHFVDFIRQKTCIVQ